LDRPFYWPKYTTTTRLVKKATWNARRTSTKARRQTIFLARFYHIRTLVALRRCTADEIQHFISYNTTNWRIAGPGCSVARVLFGGLPIIKENFEIVIFVLRTSLIPAVVNFQR
jgi:hypothetical protein